MYALVIHQGPDPLNGEQQPCEHFYLLEHENVNSTTLKYDNATGLSQLSVSQIKAGDRICGILYRHATISSTWSHTRPPKRMSNIVRGKDSKRAKNKFGQREVSAPKRKQAIKRTIDVGNRKDTIGPVPISVNELQATYIPEKLCPPPPGDATIPAEQLKAVETSLSQSSQADHLASPASPIDQPMQSCESNPPYAVLSMFDGCGSSLDILIEKFGYRPKVCVLCERDETLRYLVAEKHGISVNVQWIHSLKGGIFLYANDVDILFDDGARILREFVTLSDCCHVFVIGGSPCTDLTYAGQEHGRLGICGPDSVFFFTMHLALYLLGTVLPKTHIRFLIENAGSMHYDHFTFIRACLGLAHITRDKMTWCTSKISPAKRLRLFFQNNILHDTVDSQALCQEDLQWPADWKPLSIHDKGKFRDVFIKPFMRPLEVLSDTALRYSWTSYHPAALLWRTSYWHTHERFAVIANMFTDSSVPAFQWSDFIPAIYYPAWRRFLSCFYNKTSSNPEKDAVLRDVLPLFHNSSIRVPFRFLTDTEVLQVSGLSRNFATISRLKHVLHSHTIRSFVGNSFHPKLISLAIGTPDHVRAWIQGKTECFFGVASPDDVRQGYISFRQTVENNLKMSGRSTQTTIVPEPYRHINYRNLVMSPVKKPPIAQPIVTQKLPHYLTKEAIDNSNKHRRDQRFDILGKEPLIKFLTDLNLFDYAEQAAVPQWIFFNEEIVQALRTLSADSDALNVYHSIYIPPSSPKAFVSNTLQTIIALTDYPVFVGGDFNRCDQNHFHTWDDFLVQAGLTDVDPALPTYKYQDQESSLDRFLVPSLFLDATQLFACIYGRYRIDTCHHKALMLRLKMKPRLRPHPQSEKHHTIPTQVFLDPTIASESLQAVARQASLLALKRKISLAQETKPASVVLSHHSRAIVWSWWRTHSCHFKKLAPLKRLYKLLGKEQTHLHIRQEELRLLYEQSADTDLLQSWQTQQGCLLIPATVIASALQATEVATATNTQMPFGTDNTDPVQRIRRQKIFWDRLKTVCPKGTF